MPEHKVPDVVLSATKEHQSDIQARAKAFNADMIKLLEKHEIAIGASAFLRPNGTIDAQIVLSDAREQLKQRREEAEKAVEEAKPIIETA